ncbi:MAG: tetratricopeptide repeat protein [Candidatus Heimdallarchaeota archaeon]|nr:MAG: tetratricopeptide repeat protein [Candidatus Heimdallarchaeota archaeon]
MAVSFISDLITRLKAKLKLEGPTQKLEQVERLIQEGKLDEAMREIQLYEDMKNLTENDRLRGQILKCEILNEKRDYKNGLKLSKQILEESEGLGQSLLMIDAMICQGNALLGMGELDDSFKITEKVEVLLKKIEDIKEREYDTRHAATTELKGKICRRKGDMNLALDLLQESLSIREKLKDFHAKADLLNNMGIIHASKGEFDPALDYLQKSLEIYEELKMEQPIIKLFNNIGLIYSYKGELDKSLEYYQKSLDLSEKFENKQISATLLLNIGQIYLSKGELDFALDYNQRSLALYEELDSTYELAICLNNIGNIFESKGELVQALEVYTRSLNLFEKIQEKSGTALSMNNIGNVYRSRGEATEAISYYTKSLELLEEAGNNLEASSALLNLVLMTIYWEDVGEPQPYLQKLQEIDNKEENKAINQIYRLAKAIVLRKSARVVKQAEAQQIFQQIAEEEIIQHERTVDAMLNLCEMLLLELRTSGNEEVLKEITGILEKLQTIGENQHSYSLLVDTYMLKSKMALLELDLDSARQLLGEAQQMAEEKGLRNLAMMISGEYDTLMDQLGKWTDLIDQNVPMIEKLELTELEGMVSRIIRKKAETPEFAGEEPALFLILTETGTMRFSKQFAPEGTLDDKVIGDLLTAINNFIQETFAATGSIERIKHKEHTLLMKPIDPLLCCYVFKGQSYSALRKLDTFIDTVKGSRSLWRLLTSTTKSDKTISAEKKMEDIVSNIFLSQDSSAVLQVEN